MSDMEAIHADGAADGMDGDGVAKRVGLGRMLLAVAIGLAGAAAMMIAGIWTMQGRILYGAPRPHETALAGWTETKVEVPGQGSVGMYVKPAVPGRPTVLFMHGGGYGYEGSVKATKAFADIGMGVVIPEYPGHGGNPGSLDEASAKATALAALAKVVAGGVKAEDVILYGQDFGAGAAIAAARMPHRRLLIVSGISDMPAVVGNVYPFVPRFLVKDTWSGADELRSVKGRVTIVHAPDDAKVPATQGEALAQAAHVKVIAVPGGHAVAFNPGLQQALAAAMTN